MVDACVSGAYAGNSVGVRVPPRALDNIIMIARIWHGWTSNQDADEYERLLKEEILPEIEAKNVEGYKGIRLLRRSHQKETEFMTMMLFVSLEAVKKFAGEEYEKAYVPPKARQILARFDLQAQHYEVRGYPDD